MDRSTHCLIVAAAVAVSVSLTSPAHANCGPPHANNQQICTPGVDDCNYLLAKLNPGYADGPNCWTDTACDQINGSLHYCNNNPKNQYCDGTCCYNPDAPSNVSTFCGNSMGECCGPTSANCNRSNVKWTICTTDPNTGKTYDYGKGPQTTTDFSFGCNAELYGDPNNCNGCRYHCSTANQIGGPTCVMGKCTPGTCSPGWANCNSTSVDDGCETNTTTDVNNCGACGNKCTTTPPNTTGPACTGNPGSCGYAACNTGYRDCTPAAGCETNVTNDANNCGACGSVCKPSNAPATCAGSKCGHGTCNAGFGDCTAGGNSPYGCATPLNTANNCGACGTRCTSTQVCKSGGSTYSCQATGCTTPNTVNCPPATSGCATNISNDAMNCGGCGVKCIGTHVTNSACTASQCTGTCATGFADCNNDLQSDGCEINTNTDTTNCGGCGNVCNVLHAAAICSGGTCGYVACLSGFTDCDGDLTNGCETQGACPIDMAGASVPDMANAGSSGDMGSTNMGSTDDMSAVVGGGGADMATKGTAKSSGCNLGGPGADGNAALWLLLAFAASLMLVRRPRVTRRWR
jgi:hypothetical protein